MKVKQLFETFSEDVARQIARELLSSAGTDSSHTLSMFTNAYPDIEERDIKKNMATFIDWIETTYVDEEKQTISKVDKALSQSTVKIYRVQSFAPKRFEELQNGTLKHLGLYWTYNPKYAKAIWDKQGKNVMLLEAIVDKNFIDTIGTYAANVYWREFEIRMTKNAVVTLTKISDISTNKQLDFPDALKEYRLKKVKK